MAEVEFVDRKQAEKDAARAVKLLNASDEAWVEATFALQAVADQVGPASNTGIRGITWSSPPSHGGRGLYRLAATCVDGPLRTTTGAPRTLKEARRPEHLRKAKAALARAVDKRGGFVQLDRRPAGMSDALVVAVSASAEGRMWLERLRPNTIRQLLTQMVKVADRYGREGIYPPAPFRAHQAFLPFDDRNDLIRRFPTIDESIGKAMSLRRPAPNDGRRTPITSSRIRRLADRQGVSPFYARVCLRAALEGQSETKSIRTIKEAYRMVKEIDALSVAA